MIGRHKVAGITISAEPEPMDISRENTSLIVVDMQNGFVGTNLNIILKTSQIRYLLFIGVATNVCVGSTVRDAYHRGYFPIVVSDATASFGPEYTHDTEIWNFKFIFGWVTTTDDLIKSLHGK